MTSEQEAGQDNDPRLDRVRRVAFFRPDSMSPSETVDHLAEAFSKEQVEAESVLVVTVGERTMLSIDVGQGSVDEIVQFLADLLTKDLQETFIGLIGNRTYTHELNVAMDAAGHGTNLLLPDEIVWVVPESLEVEMRALDERFPPSDTPSASSPEG